MRLAVIAFLLLTAPGWTQDSGVLASMEREVERVESNAESAHPSPAPTEFTEAEINAYFSSGNVDLPDGVRSVIFQEQPGVVTGTAQIDFDRLKSGRDTSNPLLSVFSGVHGVVVVTHAHAAGGQGLVQVDSVAIDGMEIPRFVLQMFVEKILQPRYPEVGLTSRFAMPNRINTATVGLHKVTVTQE